MSLTSLLNRNDYTGTGAVNNYSYTFKIFVKSDLVVTVRDTEDVETTLVLDTDYSVAGEGDSAGGSITLIDASQSWLDSGNLKTDYVITLKRVRPFTQETDIRNQGVGNRSAIEDALDHLVMLAQELDERLDRSLKYPDTETGDSDANKLPLSDNRKSKYFYWDSDGNPTAVAPLDASSVTISAFIETLLDDADAATARTTLGAAGLTGNETIAGDKTFSGNVDMENNLAMGSNKITGLAAGSDPNDAVRFDQLSSDTITAEIRMYGAASPPSGWLACDGSAVSRTTYAALFAVIGTTFGVGDGSTTFNLPDLQGRVPMGVGSGAGLTSRSLGDSSGSETHTHTFDHKHATTTIHDSTNTNDTREAINPFGLTGSYGGNTITHNTVAGPLANAQFALTANPVSNVTATGNQINPFLALTFIIKT